MNPKLKAYKRNRYIANFILVCSLLMMAVLLAFEGAGNRSAAWYLLTYLTEAVLVASMADFVAILALTRGIPELKFPGLIELKRKQLIKAFIDTCETQMLPKQEILNIVRGQDVIQLMKHYLADKKIGEKTPSVLAGFIKTREADLSRKFARHVVAYIHRVDSGTIIDRIEKTAREAGWLHSFVSTIFDKMDTMVEEPHFVDDLEQKIRDSAVKKTPGILGNLKRWLGEKTKILSYRDMAISISSVLKEVLGNIRRTQSSDKRWEQMEVFLSQEIQSLARNTSFNAVLNQWKEGAVREEDLIPLISTFLKTVAGWLEDGTLTSEDINRSLKFNLIGENAKDSNITEWLNRLLSNGLNALAKNDALIRIEFDKLIEAFVQKEYRTLLEIVQGFLSALTAPGLVEKVNEVAGGNLQWLRISGACVGLLTGIVLYGVVRFPVIGLPIFVLGVIGIAFVKPVRKRLVITSSEVGCSDCGEGGGALK